MACSIHTMASKQMAVINKFCVIPAICIKMSATIDGIKKNSIRFTKDMDSLPIGKRIFYLFVYRVGYARCVRKGYYSHQIGADAV